MARDGLKIAVGGIDDLRVVRGGNGGADARILGRDVGKGPEPLDLGVHRAGGKDQRPVKLPVQIRQEQPFRRRIDKQRRSKPDGGQNRKRAQARHVGHPCGQAERELRSGAVIHAQRPVFPFHRNEKLCLSHRGRAPAAAPRRGRCPGHGSLAPNTASIRRRSPPKPQGKAPAAAQAPAPRPTIPR